MTAEREREAGFLYLEVLASMVLLAIVLLALFPMFLMAAGENAAAGDQTLTTTAAHDIAERLKLVPLASLADGKDVVRLRQLEFDRAWRVQNDVPYPGLRTVTITVTPRRTNPHGRNRVATVRFVRSR